MESNIEVFVHLEPDFGSNLSLIYKQLQLHMLKLCLKSVGLQLNKLTNRRAIFTV